MDETKERELLEDYLREHQLEAVIDEVVNGVLESKPGNPYDAMAKLLQAKCAPKITSASVSSCISAGGSGVVATVTTELGSFVAYYAIGDASKPKDTLFSDISAVNAKLEENIKGQNPVNLSKIDMILGRMDDLDASVSIAVSMACAKAGARHKGQRLFEYIASASGATPQVPVPVASLISRTAGPLPDGAAPVQDVAVCPVASQSLQAAVDSIAKVHRRLCANLQLPDNTIPVVPYAYGSMRVKSSLSQAIQIIDGAIKAEEAGAGVKIFVDYRGSDIGVSKAADAFAYTVGGANPAAAAVDTKKAPAKGAKGAPAEPAAPPEIYAQSGAEFVDSIITGFNDFALISIEDPSHRLDLETLRQFKARLTTAVDDMKRNADPKFAYSIEGVGQVPTCNVQVVADNCYSTVEDLKALNDEAVYNTVKIQLRRCRTVSSALAICSAARNYGWSVTIGSDEISGETSENFLADFAVGVGAGQISLGGLYGGEYSSKINRLFEIQSEDDSIAFAGRKFR